MFVLIPTLHYSFIYQTEKFFIFGECLLKEFEDFLEFHFFKICMIPKKPF
jgi:hypothetical protein